MFCPSLARGGGVVPVSNVVVGDWAWALETRRGVPISGTVIDSVDIGGISRRFCKVLSRFGVEDRRGFGEIVGDDSCFALNWAVVASAVDGLAMVGDDCS